MIIAILVLTSLILLSAILIIIMLGAVLLALKSLLTYNEAFMDYWLQEAKHKLATLKGKVDAKDNV